MDGATPPVFGLGFGTAAYWRPRLWGSGLSEARLHKESGKAWLRSGCPQRHRRPQPERAIVSTRESEGDRLSQDCIPLPLWDIIGSYIGIWRIGPAEDA